MEANSEAVKVQSWKVTGKDSPGPGIFCCYVTCGSNKRDGKKTEIEEKMKIDEKDGKKRTGRKKAIFEMG